MSETDEHPIPPGSPARLGCVAGVFLAVALLAGFLSMPFVQPRGYVVAGRVAPRFARRGSFVDTFSGPGRLNRRPVAVYVLRIGRWYWGVQVPTGEGP